MDEVIEKIISLPDSPPSDKDCVAISKIINIFEIKESADFKKKLTEENQKFSANVMDYMDKWFALANALTTWEKIVVSTWQKIKTNKALGNDDLLPLTILLMPENEVTLKSIIEKLDVAMHIPANNIAAFLIVNFHSAATVKLSELTSKIEKDPNEYKLAEVANEVRRVELIYQLKIVCKEYLHFLFNKLSQHLNMLQKALNSSQDAFSDEFQTLLFQDSSANNQTNLVLDKSRIICDMYLTLMRKESSSIHKLIEFAAKFSHHIDNLKKGNFYDLNFLKGSLHFEFNLFPIMYSLQSETKLLEKITALTAKINLELERLCSNESQRKLSM